MSLETIFIMALALDRTLVLPPPMPLYLLNKDKADKHREFGDFYRLKSPQWRNKLNVITTEEFLEREGVSGGRFPIPEVDRTAVLKAAKGCVHMKKSDHYCGTLDHYFQSIASVPAYHKEPYDPNVKKREGCFVFDVQAYINGGSADKSVQERAAEFCSDERHPFYFTKELNVEPIIHFKASEKGYRYVYSFFCWIPECISASCDHSLNSFFSLILLSTQAVPTFLWSHALHRRCYWQLLQALRPRLYAVPRHHLLRRGQSRCCIAEGGCRSRI